MDPHSFSLVIVSDYDSGGSKPWRDLRSMMTALASQDRGEALEFLYVEHPEAAREMPDDLKSILPRFRLILDSSNNSYGRRNAGVHAAATPWVAMLDADCMPAPNWLKQVSRSIRDNASATVISGRTRYPGHGLMERVMALISRSYVDRCNTGRTDFVSAHHCVFQREAYLQCPLPTGAGVYSARIQSELMLREGRQIWFDPQLECTHDYEGWPMERDIRRNTGHSTILVRQIDPSLPYARLVNLGPAAIPLIVGGKILLNWWDCLRCWRYYGLSPLQVPLALGISAWVHMFEIEGMWEAFRGRPITETAYR